MHTSINCGTREWQGELLAEIEVKKAKKEEELAKKKQEASLDRYFFGSRNPHFYLRHGQLENSVSERGQGEKQA